MKTIKTIGVIVLTVIVCGLMGACSSDNEEENENNKDSIKRIVKVIDEDSDSGKEEAFYTYDDQNRVIKVTSITGSSYRETNYKYGDGVIKSREVEGNWEQTHTYTLSNGLIVKDEEVQTTNGRNPSITTSSFTYDNNGYIAIIHSSSNSYEDRTTRCIWANGNLIKLDWGSEYSREYRYSDIPWNKMMICYLKGSNMDGNLWLAGYWGKRPKNLLSEIVDDCSYKYEVTNGYVTKMKYKGLWGEDYSGESIIIWE